MSVRPKSLLLVLLALPSFGAVRAWQDILTLPTYEETAPDPNPPFAQFAPDNPVYPYTIRKGFTKKRADHGWRALHLENEYLSCIVLPDLGGHLYSCRDKLSGQEMFHANPVVKKADIGLRGAWVAMGIELNFPTGHTWVAVSPVDFATTQNSDGSASIWVGNVDRVYEMQWRVEFVLRPGSTLLEQNVHLYNPTAVRHRFYWWNNAGVTIADDKTRFILPTHLVATHSFTDIDTWPVNSAGVDLSVIGGLKKEGFGLFAYESREPFMGVYHGTLRTGVIHYADVKQVPGKKVWSWGAEGDTNVIRDLSDNFKSYVEIQAGLFENQETYGFLQPSESRNFTEYWMPVRGLGGVSRANLDGVLNLARSPEAGGRAQLMVEFNANRKIQDAKIRLSDGTAVVFEESASLDPATTFTKAVKGLPAKAKYTFQLIDSAGKILLSHTEDQCDATPAGDVKLGKQAPRAREKPTPTSDFLWTGERDEFEDRALAASAVYDAGADVFPSEVSLGRAAGRLAVSQARYLDAVGILTKTLASAPNDSESRYYLGLAHVGLEEDDLARVQFEMVAPGEPLRAAAQIALGELLSRWHATARALKLLENLIAEHPNVIRAGEIQVALLRKMGQTEKARSELARFRALDPTDTTLRYEQFKLGQDDPQLWQHFGADPERVLNVAIAYMDLGLYDEAIALLDRKYPPPVDVLATEPGSVLPQHNPLVAYHRAYCRMKSGQPAKDDLRDASGYFTDYVFPSRASTYPVLQYALRENPSDATALFLLGELYFSDGETDKAIASWQQARAFGSKKVELYRLLGRALTELKRNPAAALAVYRQGLAVAPGDPEMQKGMAAFFESKAAFSVAGTPIAKAASTSAGVAKPSQPKLGGGKPPDSPKAWATYALGLAAEGNLDDANAAFSPENFPGEKQDEFVREAYMEIQVQRVLELARNRRCEAAIAADDHLGEEDRALPFTFRGFGQVLKGLHLQYFRSGFEATCGNDKEARKIWSKIEKSPREISDPDFALPFVAAAKLSPAARPRVEAALNEVNAALKSTSDRWTLLYSKGLLLGALGRVKEAQSSLAEAVDANAPPLIGYWALLALRYP